MAQQYLFENASEDRPAVYLSTVSEPLEKILRYGQTLSFFDPNAIGSRVFYEDLGTSLTHQDALSETLGRMVAMLRERRPGLLVIDSFKALHPFASDATAFRRFLQDLAGNLSAYPTTSAMGRRVRTGRDRGRRRSSRSPTASSRSPSSRRPIVTRGSCRS